MTVARGDENITVRLACIDAPESDQPPHGERATTGLEVLAGEGFITAVYRSRKLRKVCSESIGLDLRRKADVVTLAQRLGLLDLTVIYLDFGAKAA